MKNASIGDHFIFKDKDKMDIVNILNEDKPIKIKYQEDLINRIHLRYPLLEKAEIAIIVKWTFQSMRDLLVLGKVLNFNNLFFNAKLHFNKYKRDGHILPQVQIQVKTPPPLRNND